MNFNNLAISFALALLTTLSLQYFLGSKIQTDESSMQSGQRCVAPKQLAIEVNMPLNLEVDFLNEHSRQAPLTTDIETAHARYSFSTEGASITHAEFKNSGGSDRAICLSTIFPPPAIDRERLSFLVALNEKTPYYFTLVEKQELPEAFTLAYQADFGEGFLYKTFTIYKNTYQIDLTITLEPKNSNKTWQPRILFANPIVPELQKNDTISGIVNNAKNNLVVNQKTEENLNTYWSKPTLFGTQDRYFVHALVHDHNHFAQRGYYKVFDLESMYSIVEGPSVSEKTTWKVSFYVGPKIDEVMRVVDERLIQTLNYGMLAPVTRPISKLLLRALNMLYDYFKNYGVAIIVLTLIMKLLLALFSVNGWGKARLKSAEFNKKLKHLEQKYKHDKAALNAARADLITKNGIPGLSVSGCLPVLIQMPLFFALSIVVANSIELYKAPFLWIPDLTAADPYYILPALGAIAMILLTSLSSVQSDPKGTASSIFMALFIGAVTANFAAAVTLYFFVSTAFSALQTALAGRDAR